MATLIHHPNGIAGTTGGGWITLAPILTTGNFWFVDSVTGVDAADPRGKERIRPLATLAQAHTNAAAGDAIVCFSTHTEVLTAAQTFNKSGLWILGEGTGTSRAKFKANGVIDMFDVTTGVGVIFDNIYFEGSSAAATSRVKIATAECEIVDCYFDCSTSDTSHAVNLVTGAGQLLVENTTFASTSTNVASQPAGGIIVTNAMNGLTLRGVVFDGGSSGWSNPYALKCTGAVTRLVGYKVDLLNDSDVDTGSSTQVKFHLRNKTGSSRVI